MPSIEVRAGAEADVFDVAVGDGGSRSHYTVTFDEWGRRTAAAHGSTPERLVEACFRFLLDREPKEAILSRFALGVVAGYFPEVDARIGDYLG